MNKILGSIFIIGGTAIGVGMLALPINTAMTGFIPSAILLLICWIFMTIGAFCLVEVHLWLDNEAADLVSMANRVLGSWGRWITIVTYLALLYALISAYLTAGSAWFHQLIEEFFSLHLPFIPSILGLAFVFGLCVCFGTTIVDRFNRLLTAGLAIAFVVLVIMLLPHVKIANLEHSDPSTLFNLTPLMITAFGSAIVVPSLSNWMHQQAKPLIIAVFVGSLLPLLTYVVWEYITLGSLPMEGPQGFKAMMAAGDNGTQVANALDTLVPGHLITWCVRFFAIFAILTSFLGVSLALYHFLADGLGLPINHKTRFPLLALTYGPSLLVVFIHPTGFDQVLRFGGIFVAIILGILPVTMVWWGRYHQAARSTGFRVPGGKPVLLLTFAFMLFVIYEECVHCLL